MYTPSRRCKTETIEEEHHLSKPWCTTTVINQRERFLDEPLPQLWIVQVTCYKTHALIQIITTTTTQKRHDLILCDFFQWRYLNHKELFPTLLVDLAELKQHIISAISGLDSDDLACV
ncbi:hypothetical protein TNCV_2021381 [Trichonephila clavipes]|nr:hypothetical protein TNCV_2021381 [Trichonephila clavipes]